MNKEEIKKEVADLLHSITDRDACAEAMVLMIDIAHKDGRIEGMNYARELVEGMSETVSSNP